MLNKKHSPKYPKDLRDVRTNVPGLAGRHPLFYIPSVHRPPEFIVPCSPALRARPPEGDAWLHEIKFDGWRIKLHKRGRDVAIYTKNGHDYTKRLPAIAAAVSPRSLRHH
jgi:hypothetical protein